MACGKVWRFAAPLLVLGLIGCRGSYYPFAEREAWRAEAEERCLAANLVQGSAAVEPARVDGPGACGMSHPLKVTALNTGGSALASSERDPSFTARVRQVLGSDPVPASVSRRPRQSQPVMLEPKATLACPLISAVDRWVGETVQPAARAWFREPVVEIRQISSYACRPMNGMAGARISEHSFGNALDVAAFRLASGREVTVRDGWRGSPDERGFLRQVHAAACERFSTVLGPGSDAFHYDHFHLDLARRASGNGVCRPAPQEVPPPTHPTRGYPGPMVQQPPYAPAPPMAPTPVARPGGANMFSNRPIASEPLELAPPRMTGSPLVPPAPVPAGRRFDPMVTGSIEDAQPLVQVPRTRTRRSEPD